MATWSKPIATSRMPSAPTSQASSHPLTSCPRLPPHSSRNRPHLLPPQPQCSLCWPPSPPPLSPPQPPHPGAPWRRHAAWWLHRPPPLLDQSLSLFGNVSLIWSQFNLVFLTLCRVCCVAVAFTLHTQLQLPHCIPPLPFAPLNLQRTCLFLSITACPTAAALQTWTPPWSLCCGKRCVL